MKNNYGFKFVKSNRYYMNIFGFNYGFSAGIKVSNYCFQYSVGPSSTRQPTDSDRKGVNEVELKLN